MKNRSKPDIVAIILDAANGGVTKTRLLSKANLTSIQLKQYIDMLLERDLVTELLVENNSRRVGYRTTEKGLRYLAIYSALKNIIAFAPQADNNSAGDNSYDLNLPD